MPIAVGLVAGERPGWPALAGAVVALSGVVGAAGPGRAGRGGSGPAVTLAVLTAVLFGVEICCLAQGSRSSVLLTLVGMRLSALACTATALVPLRRRGRHAARVPAPARRRDLPGPARLGVLDSAATLAWPSRPGAAS